MKTTYVCAECLMRQAQEACDQALEDWEERYETIVWVIDKLQNSFHDAVPELLATEIHRMVKSAAADSDPYQDFKQETNVVFRSLVDELRPELETLKDRTLAATLGNGVEAAVPLATHADVVGYLAEPLSQGLQRGFAIDEFDKFEQALQEANTVLYLTDNCGEIALDALLIEAIAEMGKTVVISPKEKPILNDATVTDVEEMGLGQYGAIIPHTRDTLGLTMESMAEGFIEVWDNSDLVIAKGIGYYQTLFGVRENIAFLLQAVCEPVARSLRVKKGDNIILF
jgi:damage-control phosphatase, subfamily I